MMMEMEYSYNYNSYEDNFNLPSWTSWMDDCNSELDETPEYEPEPLVHSFNPITVESLDLKVLDDRSLNFLKLDLLHCNLLTCNNCSIKFILSACTYQPTTICTNCNHILPINTATKGCTDYAFEEEGKGLDSINLNQLLLQYGNRYLNFRSTLCFVKLQVDYSNEELVVVLVTDLEFQIYSTGDKLKLLYTIPIQPGSIKFIEHLDADIYHIMVHLNGRKLLLTQHFTLYLKLKQLLTAKLELNSKLKLETKYQKFNVNKEPTKTNKSKFNHKLKFHKKSGSGSSNKSIEPNTTNLTEHLTPINNYDLSLQIYSNRNSNLSLPNLSLKSHLNTTTVPDLSLSTSKSFTTTTGSDEEIMTPRSPKSPTLQLIPPIPTFSDNYFNLTKDTDLVVSLNPNRDAANNSLIYLTKSTSSTISEQNEDKRVDKVSSKENEKVEQFNKRLSIYNSRLVPPYPGAKLIGDQYSQIGWSNTQLKSKRSMNLKTSFDSLKKSLKSLPKFKDRGVRPNSLAISSNTAITDNNASSNLNHSKTNTRLERNDCSDNLNCVELPKLSTDSSNTTTEDKEEDEIIDADFKFMDELLNNFPLPPKRN